MSYNATRLTLYALLSAIETDLRDAISKHLGGQRDITQILKEELFAKVFARFQRDQGTTAYAVALTDLVNYLDFDESFQVLNTNRSLLDSEVSDSVRTLTGDFQKLAPIRNRVMHGRPLDFDDLSVTLDATARLQASPISQWANLGKALTELRENPAFVLGLSIPIISDALIDHNLPIPDFDETGFLGRRTFETQLEQLIRGPYPVITVIGEGGIGKTALVLKVAYSLLDSEKPLFDAIVWSSAKANQITAQEIVRIQGAITDSLGMLKAIRNHVSHSNDEDPIAEIIEYLREFKILLILDNLETVKDARIVDFLDRLPTGSKVVITSRIGLGEYERRLPLEPMSEADSTRLLRSLLKSRGLTSLDDRNPETLAAYCRRMKNNPGYIKWFVSALETGKRAEQILDQSAIFLDYCMSNVYEYLNEDAKVIVQALQCIPQQLSQPELAFVTRFQVLRLQAALQQLMTTNMVRLGSVGKGLAAETKYSLSELAREYLLKHHSVPKEQYTAVRGAYQEIQNAEQLINQEGRLNPYSFYSISMRSKGEVLVGKYLLDALKAAQRHEISTAQENVDNARALSPQYFEVHRVAAYVHVIAGNLSAAEECYEAAIEYAPDSAPLRYWYGNFLARFTHDPERGLKQFSEAERLDPSEPQISLEKARAYCYLSKFREAHKIIDQLLGERRLFPAVLRKVYDLRLQCFQREVNHWTRQKDIQRAYDTLEKLIHAVVQVPRASRDAQVIATMKRVCSMTSQSEKRAGDLTQKENLVAWRTKIIAELETHGIIWDEEHLSRYHYGQISSVKGDYGFIAGEDLKSYFFHFRSIRSAMNPGEQLVGREVRFELGANTSGVCAINVNFAEIDEDEE